MKDKLKLVFMILLVTTALVWLPSQAQAVNNNADRGGNGGGYGGGNGGGGNGGGGNGGGNGGGGNGGGGNGGGGNGGGGGGGYGQGPGNCTPIIDGVPFTFNGTVVSIGIYGDGMVVATDNGELTVTGLGPNHYWYNLNLTKPVIGDQVSGNGFTVDYSGTVRNVLTDITLNGTQVNLRDADGLPLWRGVRGPRNPQPGAPCDPAYNILNGTPFTYQGDVISVGLMSDTNRGHRGDGMVISTSEGNISVSGLGPYFYWENADVRRPVVGDNVTVTGYIVDFNGSIVYVLMSIEVDGTTLQLRDPETGLPLWR